MTITENTTDASRKVLIGLEHDATEPENVLISYLMGVEALRAGKEAVVWLTKDGVNVALRGYADKVDVPGAPSVTDLHEEFVERGGRFFACPVCVKLRDLADADWSDGTEIAGAPAVYAFTEGGALTFNY